LFIGIKEVGSLTYRELIEANPSVMLGKPVIDGTRITVEMILEKVATASQSTRSWKTIPA